MKVKIISKKNEWFDENTEVINPDTDSRFTIEDFSRWLSSESILCKGLQEGK